MKVATTHDIIEKLQAYEKENGIGVVTNVGRFGNGDRTTEYTFEVANDSDWNRVFCPERYKETIINIDSVNDDSIFKRKVESE